MYAEGTGRFLLSKKTGCATPYDLRGRCALFFLRLLVFLNDVARPEFVRHDESRMEKEAKRSIILEGLHIAGRLVHLSVQTRRLTRCVGLNAACSTFVALSYASCSGASKLWGFRFNILKF